MYMKETRETNSNEQNNSKKVADGAKSNQELQHPDENLSL